MSDDPTKTRDPAPSPGENPPATDTPGRSHPLQGEDERIAEAWLAQSDPSPQLYTDLGEIDSIDRPSRSSRRRRLLIT